MSNNNNLANQQLTINKNLYKLLGWRKRNKLRNQNSFLLIKFKQDKFKILIILPLSILEDLAQRALKFLECKKDKTYKKLKIQKLKILQMVYNKKLGSLDYNRITILIFQKQKIQMIFKIMVDLHKIIKLLNQFQSNQESLIYKLYKIQKTKDKIFLKLQ